MWPVATTPPCRPATRRYCSMTTQHTKQEESVSRMQLSFHSRYILERMEWTQGTLLLPAWRGGLAATHRTIEQYTPCPRLRLKPGKGICHLICSPSCRNRTSQLERNPGLSPDYQVQARSAASAKIKAQWQPQLSLRCLPTSLCVCFASSMGSIQMVFSCVFSVPGIVLWVGGHVSLCPRLRPVSRTPQLACMCTLSHLGLVGRGPRRGPRSTSTRRLAGAPGCCLQGHGGGGRREQFRQG